MRSALLGVPGVARVQVTLENGDAVVTYDPRTTTVDALMAVVNDTAGPLPHFQYVAKVKEGPRAVSAP